MKSIRSYLMWRLLGGTALVLAVACAAVYALVAQSLEAQFDRNLVDRVQGFASVLFQTKDQLEFEFSGELMPEYSQGAAPAYFELWQVGGELLERSESLGEHALAVQGTASEVPMHWSAPLVDGREGRYVAQIIEVHHVYPEEGPDRPQAARILVVIARGREELVAAENAMLRNCLLIAVLLMGLIAALSWTSVERGLAPARRLASQLDGIDVHALPDSLDVGPVPSELAPVAEKADALIRRVDLALKRERRTAADIAHELRTPISEILTVSEVALRGRLDTTDARRALATVRDVAWRMGGSVSTLLKLARLQMGADSFGRVEVDLAALVREALRPLAAHAHERELRIENGVPEDCLVTGDPEVLRIVLSNLISNALYYSPPRGAVFIRVQADAGGYRFEVENQAHELRSEDLAALTEPFWRKDFSRTDRDRSGLGLTLSHALAQELGLVLSFELEGTSLRASLTSREARVPREPAMKPRTGPARARDLA